MRRTAASRPSSRLAFPAAALYLSAFAASAQEVRVLHSFDGLDGSLPQSRLVELNGAFYGTAWTGGDDDCGTIFRVTADGSFEVLHHMIGSLDGCAPPAGLVAGPDGLLYGVAEILGPVDPETGYGGGGSLFRISPDGDFRVLHSFGGAGQPAQPIGALTLGSDGLLYGTTSGGLGTVFSSTLEGEVTVLHEFELGLQAGDTGFAPRAALTQGPDGRFYGTTYLSTGAPCDTDNGSCGTVFRIGVDGDFEELHVFTQTEGTTPDGPLALGEDGRLYGATTLDAASLFRIGTDGVFETLRAFDYSTGGTLLGGLTLGAGGDFYGTGSSGALVRVTPDGEPMVVIALNDVGGVFLPQNGVIQGSDGDLYGTSSSGGEHESCGIAGLPASCGTVFQITLASAGEGEPETEPDEDEDVGSDTGSAPETGEGEDEGSDTGSAPETGEDEDESGGGGAMPLGLLLGLLLALGLRKRTLGQLQGSGK